MLCVIWLSIALLTDVKRRHILNASLGRSIEEFVDGLDRVELELGVAVEISDGFVVDRATDFEHVKWDRSGLGILICDQSTRETVAWLGPSIGRSKLIPLLELFLGVIADDQDSRPGKDKVIDFVA